MIKMLKKNHKPLICVPLQEGSAQAALRVMSQMQKEADLTEVWLDSIPGKERKTVIANAPLPVLAVCKKPSDGGVFKGTYQQMALVLKEASENGAKYIDLPLKYFTTGGKWKKSKAELIISYHNFAKTPSNRFMLKKAQEMKTFGADIVKIAVTANSQEDALAIITLADTLRMKGLPHILIAMGEKGRLTRILTPLLGGTMMFAPIEKKQASASGQLTVAELKQALRLISQ